MRHYLAGRAGQRGRPLALRALDLADERSRSPAESRLRLIWVLDARLPRPFCNRPVYSLDGRLLGVPDLLDVEVGVVWEYDGADHRRRGRHANDVRREDLFRRHGLEYFKVVGPDLRDHGLVVDRMRATRQRAAWAPVADRRWTTQGPSPADNAPPPDLTLDDRLDLLGHQAALHEEWQR